MTTKVIAVKENQTRQQAARLLSQHRISGLPVVNDENAVVGVVTEHDVIGRQGEMVDDIMTRSVISVAPDTDVEAVSHILVHDHIKRLQVASIRKQFVPMDGQPVIRDLMPMPMSADHRILYGATVARFLQEIKRLLQSPYSLLG